ncbi:MAG: prepilin-type N-terminal cleavage/methylation domain-containing protein [Nitrospinota bacterium]
MSNCIRKFSLSSTKDHGFTLVEILVSLVIFTIGIAALASVSLNVISGNNFGRKYIEAAALAQDTLEEIQNERSNFNLGTDMLLDAAAGGDDTIPTVLANCNTGTDGSTNAALLFASPDHAYPVAAGVETKQTNPSNALVCPIIDINAGADLDSNGFRRTWSIDDGIGGVNGVGAPAPGMKTVTVVIGWNDRGTPRYLMVSTAIQGN